MAAYPINSMTGYARGRTDSPAGELQLELRTVNHRYLDISMRVPEELRALENPLRQRLKNGLGRGKVEAFVRLRSLSDDAQPLEMNDAALDQLLSAVKNVARRCDISAQVDPLTLMRWPGILRDHDLDMDALSQAFDQLVDKTLADLCQVRNAEGARLGEVLESRLSTIESLIVQVQTRLPVQSQLWREKLEQRLSEMTEMEPERREQALVQFVQRLDVDEEIERLKSHVTAVRDELNNKEPVGRKLDFFMQEFNREANTLGSKSMDAELTKLAVELKVVIEQMREQVQNIE
ncbi:MAG: YicC/YloC family endoribonuclease [Oceanococcus sp.]